MDTRFLQLTSREASERETSLPQVSRRYLVGEIRRGHSAAMPLWPASLYSTANRWSDHIHQCSKTLRGRATSARDEDLPVLRQHWQEASASHHDSGSCEGYAAEQQRDGCLTDCTPGTWPDSTSIRTARRSRRQRVEADHSGRVLLLSATLTSLVVECDSTALPITLIGER